jgi:hypothetical protein
VIHPPQAQIRFLHSDVAINHLLAGAGSGFIATVFTIPFDVVKVKQLCIESVSLHHLRFADKTTNASNTTSSRAAVPEHCRRIPQNSAGMSCHLSLSLSRVFHCLKTTIDWCLLILSISFSLTGVQEEGWRGLTTGLSARLMYLIPATSITFTAYEKYKLLLGVK